MILSHLRRLSDVEELISGQILAGNTWSYDINLSVDIVAIRYNIYSIQSQTVDLLGIWGSSGRWVDIVQHVLVAPGPGVSRVLEYPSKQLRFMTTMGIASGGFNVWLEYWSSRE